jgi:hypothetical protein
VSVENWKQHQSGYIINSEKIANEVPTYLLDPQEAVTSLKTRGALPINERLFTADATAMYMNIEPAMGIAAAQAWLT